MRYQSLPRRILDGLTALHKGIIREFGIFGYVLEVFALFILWKPLFSPVLRFIDKFSLYVTYGLLGAVGIYILYLLFKKMFRR